MGTQRNMFMEIWQERNHVSEVSGKPLHNIGHWLFYHQFAHVLSKGTFSKYKLRKKNIMLMLPEEHAKQETFEAFNEKHDELLAEYYKEFPLIKKL